MGSYFNQILKKLDLIRPSKCPNFYKTKILSEKVFTPKRALTLSKLELWQIAVISKSYN